MAAGGRELTLGLQEERQPILDQRTVLPPQNTHTHHPHAPPPPPPPSQRGSGEQGGSIGLLGAPRKMAAAHRGVYRVVMERVVVGSLGNQWGHVFLL